MCTKQPYRNLNEKDLKFEERTTAITPEELKELDSFKDYNEEQAAQLIQTMKTFARIVYHIMASEEQAQDATKGKIIELNINHTNNAA